MDKSKVKINYGKFGDVQFPKIVYKYRSWNNKYHKRFITHREVFMSSPRAFEDELDCVNPTRFDMLNNEQFYKHYFSLSKRINNYHTENQHHEFAIHYQKKAPFKNEKYLKEYMDNSIQEYFDREGILSLTENCNIDAMWDKYADLGKGFCIGYNTDVMFQKLGGGGIVTYVDSMPDIYPTPFMNIMEATMKRVYYKLKKWSFEEEYRTSKFMPQNASIKDRRIQLPKEAFSIIILGDNISDKNRKEVIVNVNDNIGDIKIIERKEL